MDTFNFTVSGENISVLFQRELIIPRLPSSGGIYIADSHTVPLLRGSTGFDPAAPLVVIPAGEANKTLSSIETILSAALEAGLARDSLFIGFGGGVITDMTAFAASLYMRGAGLELIPTTLLAMADAAIGGKTGVDFGNFKNCVGTFFPAQKIHISVNILSSLNETEYRSGLAEVFKTALLYDADLFHLMTERRDSILSREQKYLSDVVTRCVQAKAQVVERDFRESGERMYLNLGHTFGHALESVAGFGSITHGDAVAWGISRALELGMRLGITDPAYAAEVRPVLTSYGWSVDPVHPVLRERIAAGSVKQADIPRLLLTAMKNDKKKRAGAVRFVLQRELNSTLVTEAPDADVLAVLT